jgi:hypothetical protein
VAIAVGLFSLLEASADTTDLILGLLASVAGIVILAGRSRAEELGV